MDTKSIEKIKNSTFLILGGSGFIGSNLIKQVVKQNGSVLSLSRTKQLENIRGARHVIGNVRNKVLVSKLLQRKPNIIINVVGFSGQSRSNNWEDESLELNTLAHIELLRLVKKINPKAKIIFSSSRLEYGKVDSLPVDEDFPAQPLSFYGFHKYLSSLYSMFTSNVWGLDIVVLRSSNPYGPYSFRTSKYYNIVNYFIDSVKHGKPIIIFGKGDQVRDYIFIDDLVDAFLSCALSRKTAGQIYNVGSGEGIKLIDMAKKIIQIAQKGKILHRPWPKKERFVETGDYVANIKKINRDTGWKPKIILDDGLNIAIHS